MNTPVAMKLLLEDVRPRDCATYGIPARLPLAEEDPQQPVNPYGYVKLVAERMLKDVEAAHGIRHVALRYFNAAGADPDGELGELHEPETHLIPLVLFTALGRQPSIEVFGNDYPTPDGTCIREFVQSWQWQRLLCS